MNDRAPTTVVFVCRKCDTTYSATQSAKRDSEGQFNCPSCAGNVHVWAGRYDYTDWKAFAN